MFYGVQTWDPVLIVAQIVTLQCLFYLSFGLLLYLLLGALELPVVAFAWPEWCHISTDTLRAWARAICGFSRHPALLQRKVS